MVCIVVRWVRCGGRGCFHGGRHTHGLHHRHRKRDDGTGAFTTHWLEKHLALRAEGCGFDPRYTLTPSESFSPCAIYIQLQIALAC